MPEERLQKALARAGFGSRRACEEMIAAGRATIDGKVATLGDKVDTSVNIVTLDGHQIPLDPDLRYLLLHKPAGIVTTMDDPQGRPDITSLLPEGDRVFPVGRLDLETEGLLLLTNDGELTHRLTHPRYAVEKEYLAEVDGSPGAKHLAKLRDGVELEDGPAKVARAQIVGSSKGKGAIEIVMTEGRKREVRRLLEAVDLPVLRLIRVRQGPVRLGDLAVGTIRPLTTDEVRGLYEVAGL